MDATRSSWPSLPPQLLVYLYLIAGPLSDRIGRKRTYQIGFIAQMAIASAGSSIPAVSPLLLAVILLLSARV
jgi:MFS family permease